jgi:hypothetical protein
MTIFEKLQKKYFHDQNTLRVVDPFEKNPDGNNAKEYESPFTDDHLPMLLDESVEKIFLNSSYISTIPKVHDNVLLLDISEIGSYDGCRVDGEKGEFFGQEILAIDMSNSTFDVFKNITFPPNLIYLDLGGTIFGEVENITFPTDHTVYVLLDEDTIFDFYKFMGPNVEVRFDEQKVFEEICNRISQQETIDNQ